MADNDVPVVKKKKRKFSCFCTSYFYKVTSRASSVLSLRGTCLLGGVGTCVATLWLFCELPVSSVLSLTALVYPVLLLLRSYYDLTLKIARTTRIMDYRVHHARKMVEHVKLIKQRLQKRRHSGACGSEVPPPPLAPVASRSLSLGDARLRPRPRPPPRPSTLAARGRIDPAIIAELQNTQGS